MPPTPLCLWCKKPINSRRRGLTGVAAKYCTQRCMSAHAEAVLQSDPSNLWSAPPGSDPTVGYKFPKFTPKIPPPPPGSNVWDFVAWATVEFVERYRQAGGKIPFTNPTGTDAPSSPRPTGPTKEQLLKYLGLPPEADLETAEKAYRKLAKQYHPDCGGSEEKMKQLNMVMTRLRELMK